MNNYFFAQKDWPYHVSSGGVVYRGAGLNLEFALLRRYKNHSNEHTSVYSLPKGTLHPNESLEAGALREVKEETGLDGRIQTYLGAHTKVFNNPHVGYDWDRTTHYFLVEMIGGGASEQQLDPTEFYELEWYTSPRAVELLKPNPKEEHVIIERALEYLGRATT